VALLPPHRSAPDQPPARQGRSRRVAARLLALAAAALIGATLLPAPVQAAPTAEQIEAQIDKQWEQLEPTIEQYNKVRAQLKVNRAKAVEIEKKIEPLALQTELALNRVGDLANRYYRNGPSVELGALLVTDKPGSLAEQLSILDRLAALERKDIEGVLAVRARYDAEKAELDKLIAVGIRQEKELAARKVNIDKEIKKLRASMPKTVVSVQGCPTISNVVGTKAQIAVRTACQQVGDPYVWGAVGPNSFDCSGLTQYAWKAAGVYLTHYTGAQMNEGRSVSRSEARPGDLVFYEGHVGLYIGNGLMVHAPREGKPVQVASIDRMGKGIIGFRRPG